MIPKPKPTKGKSRRAKAVDIPPKVRKIVKERDSINGAPCCIYSGLTYNLEMAHYIPRSQNGLGIPENLVILNSKVHEEYDNGNDEKRTEEIKTKIEDHLKSKYPNWNKEDLIYRK